jgi:hypothetical protein
MKLVEACTTTAALLPHDYAYYAYLRYLPVLAYEHYGLVLYGRRVYLDYPYVLRRAYRYRYDDLLIVYLYRTYVLYVLYSYLYLAGHGLTSFAFRFANEWFGLV